MKKGWIYVLLLIALVGFILYSNQSGNANDEVRPQVGFIAPDFTLTNEQGEQVTLSQYRGQPVFINFWASWCPPCKEEMPYIQEAYEKYGDEVVFLGINVTPGDSRENAIKFMDSNNYEMPILFDLDGNVTNTYRSISIPTSFFIDKNGVIKAKYVGPMNYEQIEDFIQETLED